MNYDKIGGRVGYNDEAHSYTNLDTQEKYMSVTTFIGKFKPEFQADYWSTYKAIKDEMEDPFDWRPWATYKKLAGGWEGVVAYFNTKQGREVFTPGQLKAIELRKADYLIKWEQEKEEACELGSAIHKELEDAAVHYQHINHNEVNYTVSQEDILKIQDFTTNGVYPELLIYNDEYKLAGQADKIFKEGVWIDVHDYKTCKEIATEGFRDETMLPPLQRIPNANWWHYTIQLSMYGWMLEQLGYKVRSLYMHWLFGRGKDRSNVRSFNMAYRPDLVEMMLKERWKVAA